MTCCPRHPRQHRDCDRPRTPTDSAHQCRRPPARGGQAPEAGARGRRAGRGIVVALLLALPLAKRAVNALGLPLQYSSVIRHEAAAKHLDPALVAAVIYAETKFDPRTSSAGAVGLMQLLPETATFLAKRSGATTFTTADLATPQVNIAYGSYYLRYLLNEYHGDTVLALAAYNGGETNVDSWVRSAHARRAALPRRRHPVPRDPRLRPAGARPRAASTAGPTRPRSASAERVRSRPGVSGASANVNGGDRGDGWDAAAAREARARGRRVACAIFPTYA